MQLYMANGGSITGAHANDDEVSAQTDQDQDSETGIDSLDLNPPSEAELAAIERLKNIESLIDTDPVLAYFLMEDETALREKGKLPFNNWFSDLQTKLSEKMVKDPAVKNAISQIAQIDNALTKPKAPAKIILFGEAKEQIASMAKKISPVAAPAATPSFNASVPSPGAKAA